MEEEGLQRIYMRAAEGSLMHGIGSKIRPAYREELACLEFLQIVYK
jgi:hypothetical protein